MPRTLTSASGRRPHDYGGDCGAPMDVNTTTVGAALSGRVFVLRLPLPLYLVLLLLSLTAAAGDVPRRPSTASLASAAARPHMTTRRAPPPPSSSASTGSSHEDHSTHGHADDDDDGRIDGDADDDEGDDGDDGNGPAVRVESFSRLASCALVVSRTEGTDSPSCGPPAEGQKPCATIRQAIANAREGQTVCVSADAGVPYPCAAAAAADDGVRVKNDGAGVVFVNKSITLLSINGTAVIDCEGGLGPVFVVQNTTGAVIIDGFAFKNVGNSSLEGGAITANNASSVEIRNCEFRNLTAVDTGAIYAEESQVRVFNSSFVENRGQYAGGLQILYGNLTIERCHFSRMESVHCGVLRLAANVSILNSTFANNTGRVAGVICTVRLTPYPMLLTIADASFVGNSAGYAGVLAQDPGVTSIIERCDFSDNVGESSLAFSQGQAILDQNRFRNNSGAWGACIYLIGRVQMKITNNSFMNNSATSAGAAIYAALSNGSLLHVVNSTFERNQAEQGGAINLYQQLENVQAVIDNNAFIANSATKTGGGAVFIASADGLCTPNEVWIRNNIFVNNSALLGGTLQLSAGNVTIHFENNLLQGNVGWTKGGGAVVLLHFGEHIQNVQHTFLADRFIDNSAGESGGGAVYIYFPEENPDESHPFTWRYTNNTSLFQGVLFQNNSATCPQCVGGAINILNGQTQLRGCTFLNNQATQLGGAIMLSGTSSALYVTNSSFLFNRAGQGGSNFYSVSTGNLTFTELIFRAEGEGSLIAAPQGSIYTQISHMDIQCPRGYIFHNRTVRYKGALPNWGIVPMLEIDMGCSVCAKDTYSLAGSHVLPSGDKIITPSCFECPNGADCSLGADDIQALNGYYCARTDEAMADCISCPEGYCAENIRPLNEVCASNRRGILCGECKVDTSEAFGTYDCVPEAECSGNTWWLAIVLFIAGLIYVLISVHLPINHHPLWKSITYFIQIVPLVSSPDNDLLRGTVAVFSLDVSILGLPVELCPWKSFSAVEKIVSDYILPALLLGQLLLVLVLHTTFRWLLNTVIVRWRDQHGYEAASDSRPSNEISNPKHASISHRLEDKLDTFNEEDIPYASVHGAAHHETSHGGWAYSRYVAAFVGLVLLTYEGVTSATMALLNCTKWNGQLRLVRAGYITCYASWQYLLFAVLGGFLVPFPFLLIGLRRWLSSRLRSLKKHDRERGEGEWEEAALEVLEQPYSRDCKWWESAGLVRRLALLTIATFVPDPTWRALSLTAGCFVVALSHFYMRPFADKYHGTAESFFLCDLVFIAILQIPQSDADALGRRFEDATASAMSYLQLVLSILPIAFCVFVVIKHYLSPLVTRSRLLQCWRFISCGWTRNGRSGGGGFVSLLINDDDEHRPTDERRNLLPPDFSDHIDSDETDAAAEQEGEEESYQAIDGDKSEHDDEDYEGGQSFNEPMILESSRMLEMEESRFLLRFRSQVVGTEPSSAPVLDQ